MKPLLVTALTVLAVYHSIARYCDVKQNFGFDMSGSHCSQRCK